MIVTALRIARAFDRSKTKTILGSDCVPVLPLRSIERALVALGKAEGSRTEEAERIKELESQNARSLRFINSTIHEIRALNAQIKSQSEQLGHELDLGESADYERLAYLKGNLFATSSLVSMRLNAFDFHTNPELVFGEAPKAISIHGRFTKIAHCLRIAARREHARIHLDGRCYALLYGHDIFEMLPFVLLDNAVKFSPLESDIYVSFFENAPDLTITVVSTGPQLQPGEETEVLRESVRGEYAQAVSTGSGLGLALAKQISDHYNIALSVKSGNVERTVDGLPYARFIVTMEFDPSMIMEGGHASRF